MIKKAMFSLGLCFSLAFGASQYLMASYTYCNDCNTAYFACSNLCIQLEGAGRIGQALVCWSECDTQWYFCNINCTI
ncbi:MAG: hypothetical protein QNK37_18340 [Acidobacteriota bacterium]|nr:hypothetical protein [Acidobacteriota bacterium]